MPLSVLSDANTATNRSVIDRLRNHGISPTSQRLLVARILFKEPREHLTADQVLARVQAQGGGCSRATVYNALNLFVAQRLIKALAINTERTYYDSNTAPHAHTYNVDNGQVTDLALGHIADKLTDALPKGVELVDMSIVLQVRAG